MKKSAMKGILFLSIIFMSISLHGESITGDQFFRGAFTDNNLTITTTKKGGWITGHVHAFQSSSFNGHNTLNIDISNITFFERNTARSTLRMGTEEIDRTRTLNITANGSINRLFDLESHWNGGGNAYAAVISPNFVLDASGVNNPNFQAFYISTGYYIISDYYQWPVTASISFGSDVIVSGLSGTQKFAIVQDNDNNANASLWLNHMGGISAENYKRNYYGENIYINTHAEAPIPSDIFAKRTPRTDLNNYKNSSLDKMLKISGDIIINGSSFTGARMYANFISQGNNISHYYGDISGTGNIYANFIKADFKGNAVGNIGSSTGNISGDGIREVAFVFRDNVAARSQFNLNVANNNPSNKWYIENANISGRAISTAGDVWNAFAGAGINFTGTKDGNLTFTKSSIEVTSGTLTGSFTGYFGNKSHTTDWWGNAQTSTNYTKTYTLRKAGSTVDANVSDANIGTASDAAKKLVYFLYTPNTFTDATGKITDFGYTGTILGGTADSVYHFDNAGYIYQNQLNKAIGAIALNGQTRYADMVFGNNNEPINDVRLDMGATNPNRGNGSVVGNAANRKVELDFTGITTHKDIFFNILGSGKGEYTISNLKNVSTTMRQGSKFDTTTIRKDLEYTDSILGVLGNAGVGVFTSRPASDPPNITAGTNLDGISADSKFILRGTSISGDLKDINYSYDFVFDSTSGYKGQSGLKKNIESSSYDGSEIDLSTNTRDQKLHFIGADSVTQNRLKLTLGTGKHDIAFVGLNTNGTTKTIVLDANRSTGGTYMLNGVNIENSGANHILPALDSNISINNATLTLSNMTGDQTAIDGQNNTLKSDLSGVNISLSTTGGTATAIKLRDHGVNLSGKINLNGTDTTAIDYQGQTAGTNTINITDTANINANYGIVADLATNTKLNINNTGLLQANKREIKLSGDGDVNLGVYHTKLRDFTTDITAFDPNDNNGLHSMEMTNTNSINFDKELIFTSMDTTESFYLQDMVTVDTNNTSAQWNPTATRTPGSVSASPDLKIYAPLDMFSMALDRGTGLVVVGVNPNLAPTTTFSKIILGTLESGGNKIESDVGNYLFNMSRGRYLTSTQQKVWKDKSRTQALRMAMRAKNENPNIPYNKVSTKFTKGDKKIDTANALEYLLYERRNRVEMFVEPYYIHSTLNDKDVSGKMSGYGLNGGMSINVIPQWILGWHVGLDTRSGTGRGAVSTRASTTSFVTLNTGIHTRLNLGHINQTRLVYLRGNALYQRTQAKQNTDLIGDSISLNNDATALKFDALLGMEQSTKSGDVVALELGVSKYDMTFSKESFKTGPNSEFVMDSVKKDMLYILANLRYARMYRNAMVFISPNISLGVKVLANEMNFSPELRFGAVSFVPEVSLNRFSGILDIGVDMITLGRSLTLGARYIGEYGQFMITHSVQGKVGYRF